MTRGGQRRLHPRRRPPRGRRECAHDRRHPIGAAPAITRFCLDGARSPPAARAFVIGVSGPQGGGKSTLAARLVAALSDAGLRAATVSIDDFYLTHAAQRALASELRPDLSTPTARQQTSHTIQCTKHALPRALAGSPGTPP